MYRIQFTARILSKSVREGDKRDMQWAAYKGNHARGIDKEIYLALIFWSSVH
jgi:hypothetical protein